ncbi:hypothetical protein GOODEAATRI_031666 [Goodea atripinnis]|uniref:Uncharacterized protein n=1 Tax=Goodea atripinnis TaxID=208336 RepID=A0ABV0P232_9TELE
MDQASSLGKDPDKVVPLTYNLYFTSVSQPAALCALPFIWIKFHVPRHITASNIDSSATKSSSNTFTCVLILKDNDWKKTVKTEPIDSDKLTFLCVNVFIGRKVLSKYAQNIPSRLRTWNKGHWS